MSITVKFAEEEATLKAIASVRNDSSEINWVLLGHSEDPNIVLLQGTGSDGLEGLKAKIALDQVQYGLLRVTTKVDLSVTVKFVYIYNLGEGLGFAKKGRFGIVKGNVTKYFQPYHVDVEITTPKELTLQDVTNRVEQAAGNANNVRDADFVKGKQERGFTPFMATHTAGPQATGGVSPHGSQSNLSSFKGSKGSLNDLTNKSSYGPTKVSVGIVATQAQGGVTLADDLIAAIKRVRNDKEPFTWALGAYQHNDIKNPVVLLGTGESATPVAQLKDLLTPEAIIYGLVRVTDKIDGHPTIKFAFITWIGNSVGFMTKAKLSTHKGAITEGFSQFHVDFTISESREISDDIVHDKVASYSGSKSHVM